MNNINITQLNKKFETEEVSFSTLIDLNIVKGGYYAINFNNFNFEFISFDINNDLLLKSAVKNNKINHPNIERFLSTKEPSLYIEDNSFENLKKEIAAMFVSNLKRFIKEKRIRKDSFFYLNKKNKKIAEKTYFLLDLFSNPSKYDLFFELKYSNEDFKKIENNICITAKPIFKDNESIFVLKSLGIKDIIKNKKQYKITEYLLHSKEYYIDKTYIKASFLDVTYKFTATNNHPIYIRAFAKNNNFEAFSTDSDCVIFNSYEDAENFARTTFFLD